MIDYSKVFSELVECVGELVVPSIEKEYENLGHLCMTSFEKAVRSITYRSSIMQLPLFIEIRDNILDSGILDALVRVTSREGWVELALIDYIASTRAYRVPPDDLYPTKEEVERAIKRLNDDLNVGIPEKRAFAIIDSTILGVPSVELDESIRLRKMTLFEAHSIEKSDFYYSLKMPQNLIDNLISPCIIEYHGSTLENMGFANIKDFSLQDLVGDAIQDVAMCLRLFRDSNCKLSHIWVGLGNWDVVTSVEPRIELTKAGFPIWDYSRMTRRSGSRLNPRMIPRFRLPIELVGEAIEEYKQLWTMFSGFRNDIPYTSYQKYYQTALIQYNRVILEDSPDISANALSSAIDAFGRNVTNRSSYDLLTSLLAHGGIEDSVREIINGFQLEVRNKVEHGERIDEDNYELVYKMGNLFRVALAYALFFFDKFGVFKERINFHDCVIQNTQIVLDLVPRWTQLELENEVKSELQLI